MSCLLFFFFLSPTDLVLFGLIYVSNERSFWNGGVVEEIRHGVFWSPIPPKLRHAVHDDLAVLAFLLFFLYPSILDGPLSGAGGVSTGALRASAGVDAPLVIAVDANLSRQKVRR